MERYVVRPLIPALERHQRVNPVVDQSFHRRRMYHHRNVDEKFSPYRLHPVDWTSCETDPHLLVQLLARCLEGLVPGLPRWTLCALADEVV
jgi:hypothetical protein